MLAANPFSASCQPTPQADLAPLQLHSTLNHASRDQRSRHCRVSPPTLSLSSTKPPFSLSDPPSSSPFLNITLSLHSPNPKQTLVPTTTMATTTTTTLLSLLLLSLFLFSFINLSEARLTLDYYKHTCPQFEQIIQTTVTSKQIEHPTTGAATLRLFLHDCLLPNGCDASILLSSTPFNKAERDADINLSLPGDAFDLVVRAKTALELACPNTVSCSDILTAATRDLLVMLGGPHFPVFLGRRDGRTSLSSSVDNHLPKPSMPISQITQIFTQRGFTVEDMVALSGAHTIGFSHCSEFTSELYNTSSSSSSSSYNPRFAQGLQKACADSRNNPTLSVFNDIMTPNKFDNVYFQNLPKGLGVLKSDHGLFGDPSTRPFVESFAADQDKFFRVFARAMQKLSLLGVKTGRRGEIRRRCDQIN